jgi:ribosomal-protein-serine acetyltransferase
MIIVNKNIALVLPELNMATPLFNLINENRNHLSKWFPWVQHANDTSFTQRFITNTLDQYKNNLCIPLMVVFNGKMVGRIGLYKIDYQNNVAEIGYWLHSELNNKGIMSACIKALLYWTYTTTDINRIELRCQPENESSIALALKNGFLFEGRLHHIEFINNQYVDHYLYAISKSIYLTELA